jgi:hypothetical protein
MVETFIRWWSYLFAIIVFLLLIPLNLWFAWVYHSSTSDLAIQMAISLSFGWGTISVVHCLRALRKLTGPERIRLFSGPRPTNRDELIAWNWAWRFMCAVIAFMFSIAALPITAWLIGK